MDYFDDKVARKILVEEGKLSEEDAEYVVSWISGVPWMMERVISTGNVRMAVKRLYDQYFSRLYESLRKREDLKNLVKRVLR